MAPDIKNIKDMAKYFAMVRKELITDAPAFWNESFFLNSIIVKAHQLNKGFIQLYESGNYLCAAPLVRMQLETLLRAFGGYLSETDTYITHFMEGKKVDNQTYQGKQLTYPNLIYFFNERYNTPELAQIYSRGNAFVHPTDVMFKATVWNENRKVTIQNLESKLYEDSEMEALLADMQFVNICFIALLEDYMEVFRENIQLISQSAEGTPVTEPDKVDKFKAKIERFLDNTKRDETR